MGAVVPKITFYAGINIFNRVPPCLIILEDDGAKFKSALRKYLNTHFFCSVDEFLCAKIIYNTIL
jgi:predicted transcriptional regulator